MGISRNKNIKIYNRKLERKKVYLKIIERSKEIQKKFD